MGSTSRRSGRFFYAPASNRTALRSVFEDFSYTAEVQSWSSRTTLVPSGKNCAVARSSPILHAGPSSRFLP